ncbi:hypothetical protein [Streptomyces sp. NPDC056227]|uniref:hypothetical protein n=1 Tax=Streptomyces sp. NPDC056227 TaxID=3345753 RepID=UPI0035DD0C4D
MSGAAAILAQRHPDWTADRLTAAAADGTAIHTTVGATKDVPTVDLTVNAIDRNGNSANAELAAFDLDPGAVRQVVFPAHPPGDE